MKKILIKNILMIGIIVLLIEASAVSGFVTNSAGTVINLNTGEVFSTIREAINDPDTLDGHTLQVNSGEYTGNIYVGKELTIRGFDTGSGKPVVNAGGSAWGLLFGEGQQYITIENLIIKNANYCGLWVNCTSYHNSILNNTIFDCGIGIYLEPWGYNIVSGNIISNNTYGIMTKSNSYGYSSNNLIYNNYFNNTNNANDVCTNSWNITKTGGTNIVGGPYLGGNYWSDYTGEDLDGDGLGDTPYSIPAGENQDNYPLINLLPENQPPTAEFSWTPPNPSINQSITFNASASQDLDGVVTLFEWDWDNDGVYDESFSAPTTTHTWKTIGNYPVSVRVTDDDDATGTNTKTVNVSGNSIFKFEIIGGLGVNLKISNNGTTRSTVADWQIEVAGGILGKINKTMNGTVDIPAGETKTIGTGIFFGFGPITITAKVTNEEKTAEGSQFIIFSIVK